MTSMDTIAVTLTAASRRLEDRAVFDRHRVQVEGSFATLLGIPMFAAIVGSLLFSALAHEWIAFVLIVAGGVGASLFGMLGMALRAAGFVVLVVHDQRLAAALIAANIVLVFARNAIGVRDARGQGFDLDAG